jgi:protein tyrosine/serine phosphatase
MKLSIIALALVSSLSFACASETGDGVAPEQSEDELVAKAPIANFVKVRTGLYRGGHPDANGLDYLKKLGVKTIVDLEVEDFIEAFPWDISEEVNGAQARRIALLRFPMSAFEPALSSRFDDQMDAIEKVLVDPSRAPVYVHCKHGQDRTGLVIGIERVEHEKWTPKAAHDEMVKLGFHTFFLGLEHYFEEKTGYED